MIESSPGATSQHIASVFDNATYPLIGRTKGVSEIIDRSAKMILYGFFRTLYLHFNIHHSSHHDSSDHHHDQSETAHDFPDRVCK